MIIEERKIREGLKNSNSTIISNYVEMIKYYTVYDLMHGTHHIDILHTIYECEQIYTFDGIALLCHVSRRTLDRNRKEYLECFTYCEKVETFISEAAFTLASL